MLTNEALQALVEGISLAYFGAPFQHLARFNPRLKTTGGRYHLMSHNLDFNPLVYEYYGQEELEKVIKHELCHYHLHRQGKGYHHRDKDFRELLKQTGGTRFVPPLAPKNQRKTQHYECVVCQHRYTRKKRMNVANYRCQCGGELIHLTNDK